MTATNLALDRWALRDLVEAYAIAADERDAVAFAGVFTVEGELHTGARTLIGHEALAAIPALLGQLYERTLHFVGNHRATVRADEAEGLTYCLAHHLACHDSGDDGNDTLMLIRYRDRYQRTAQGWRIARRDVEIDWQERRPIQM